jgi:hypothetical protein
MIAVSQMLQSLRLFRRPDHFSSWGKIVLWWELRRLPFNLAVGLTGILTCLGMFCLAAYSEWRFGDAIGLGSPLFAVFGIIAYGVGANVCYTGGWVSELIARLIWKEQSEHFGKIAFALGMIFSVILTVVPFVLCSAIVLLKSMGLIK